eukprot:6345479-Prymnesium_polylepis.1
MARIWLDIPKIPYRSEVKAAAAAARARGATTDDVHDPTPPPPEGVQQQREDRVAKWHAENRTNPQLQQICRNNGISMKGLKAK